MKLKLHNDTRLSEIKETFHEKFPFLKLEFFNPLADEKEKFSQSNVITDSEKTLGEVAELNKPGYVSINEHESVASLERCFKGCFGIDAQVFRKSGNSWLETISTDDRTLAELNTKGEISNIPLRPQNLPEDISEQP